MADTKAPLQQDGAAEPVSPASPATTTTLEKSPRTYTGSSSSSSSESRDGPTTSSRLLRWLHVLKRPRRSSQPDTEDDLVPEIFPTSNLDNGLVGWESQNDPEHPRNWPASRKWPLIWTVNGLCTISFGINVAIAAPGLQYMNRDFHNASDTLSTMVISIYVLGYALGPLLCSPLSEIYGRRPVLLIGSICLTAFELGCALAPNLGTLIAMRFLSGASGCGSMALAGGIIADLYPVQRRGTANAVIMSGQMLGIVAGPITGGFIAQRSGWRWAYWVQLIACGLFTILHFFFGHESNASVLIRQKTRRLARVTENAALMSSYDKDKEPASIRTLPVLRTGFARPFRLLFGCPVLLITALQQSVIFGSFSLLVATISGLFIDTYRWDAELSGLAYISVGLGFLIGLASVVRVSDGTIIRLTRRNGGRYEPEMRLPPAIVFGLCPPLCFFWYGWAAETRAPWIVAVLALVPFGVGDMGVFCSVQTYFVDAAGEYAASASGAFLALRCLFGAFLPLLAPTMYRRLGLGWGNSIIGFVNVAMIPIPIIIYKYGARIRKRYPIDIAAASKRRRPLHGEKSAEV